MGFVAGWVIEGATCRRGGYVPVDTMSGREVTPGATRTRNAVGVLALQVARPAMSILLRLNSEESRHVRNSRVEDVGRCGEGLQGKLTAEPLQRQEGCEDEGFIPERFGLSFKVAVVATHRLEPG